MHRTASNSTRFCFFIFFHAFVAHFQRCFPTRIRSICVSDQGEPVSAEVLANLFKRFYRADKARNGEGSFVLELAIAQGIVTRHRGHIRAESRGGVNRFLVELPCST